MRLFAFLALGGTTYGAGHGNHGSEVAHDDNHYPKPKPTDDYKTEASWSDTRRTTVGYDKTRPTVHTTMHYKGESGRGDSTQPMLNVLEALADMASKGGMGMKGGMGSKGGKGSKGPTMSEPMEDDYEDEGSCGGSAMKLWMKAMKRWKHYQDDWESEYTGWKKQSKKQREELQEMLDNFDKKTPNRRPGSGEGSGDMGGEYNDYGDYSGWEDHTGAGSEMENIIKGIISQRDLICMIPGMLGLESLGVDGDGMGSACNKWMDLMEKWISDDFWASASNNVEMSAKDMCEAHGEYIVDVLNLTGMQSPNSVVKKMGPACNCAMELYLDMLMGKDIFVMDNLGKAMKCGQTISGLVEGLMNMNYDDHHYDGDDHMHHDDPDWLQIIEKALSDENAPREIRNEIMTMYRTGMADDMNLTQDQIYVLTEMGINYDRIKEDHSNGKHVDGANRFITGVRNFGIPLWQAYQLVEHAPFTNFIKMSGRGSYEPEYINRVFETSDDVVTEMEHFWEKFLANKIPERTINVWDNVFYPSNENEWDQKAILDQYGFHPIENGTTYNITAMKEYISDEDFETIMKYPHYMFYASRKIKTILGLTDEDQGQASVLYKLGFSREEIRQFLAQRLTEHFGPDFTSEDIKEAFLADFRSEHFNPDNWTTQQKKMFEMLYEGVEHFREYRQKLIDGDTEAWHEIISHYETHVYSEKNVPIWAFMNMMEHPERYTYTANSTATLRADWLQEFTRIREEEMGDPMPKAEPTAEHHY